MPDTYLVTGATGNTGSAVVATLLSMGNQVHALVRNPSSAAAERIASLGAVLFQGDFSSSAALSKAAHGCAGMFLIQIPGPDAVAFATNAVTSFRESCQPDSVIVLLSTIFMAESTTKLVKSSNSGRPDKPPHPFIMGYWEMSNAVEAVVKDSGIKHWTLLRPAWFMSNYVDHAVRPIHWPALSTEKKLVAGVRPNTPFEMSDPHDTGVIAAHALVEKGEVKWEHKGLSLASELLTLEEKAAIISRVSGIEVEPVFLDEATAEKLADDDFVGWLHFWQKLLAPKVDMEEMRSYGFKLGTFEAYLNNHKAALLQALNDDKIASTGLSTEQLVSAAGQSGQ